MPLTFKTALVDAKIDRKRFGCSAIRTPKLITVERPMRCSRMIVRNLSFTNLIKEPKTARALEGQIIGPHLLETSDKRTLFCGLYASRYVGVGDRDVPYPHREGKIGQGGALRPV